MAKRYDVCVPRPYVDGNGNKKTHFWRVGTAFPMRDRDGFSLKMHSKLLSLPTAELVCFVVDQQEQDDAPPYDDDIPL